MRMLMSVIGVLAVTGSALGGVVSGSGMIVLDTSASGALSMTGNSEVDIPANSVYVNSSSSNAVTTTGSATLRTPNLYVVGGFRFTGNSGCTGAVHSSVVPYVDPMAGLHFPSAAGMTERSLSASGNATITAQPGHYAHGISVTGSSTITFAPGVYVLDDDFKVSSGSISGTGVVFVMLGGKVSVSGCSTFSLTAPDQGDLAGVSFCQPASNTSGMSLTGGSEMNIGGAIYLPGGKLTLTGNASVAGQGPKMGDLVDAKQVSLTGTGSIKIGDPAMPAVALPSMPLCD